VKLVNGIEQIADGAKAGLVRQSPVIDHRHLPAVGEAFCPVFEYAGKLVVGDDYVLIDLRDAVDVIEHHAQDGAVPYLQEGLGEVLGEFPQAGGIAGGYHYILHNPIIDFSLPRNGRRRRASPRRP